MGHVIAFDTLAFVKRLREAGVPEAQAEVQAEAIAEVINDHIETKQYLDLRLRELEMRLSLRLGGMMVTGVIVVAALVKLL